MRSARSLGARRRPTPHTSSQGSCASISVESSDKIRSRRTLDEKFVQIKRRLKILFSRRGKPRHDRTGDFCFKTHTRNYITGANGVKMVFRQRILVVVLLEIYSCFIANNSCLEIDIHGD